MIAGLLMIATTLRVTFTGAAPLLDAIRADYGLTTAQTGMLTTLPLLAFALVSPLAASVARRIGMERSLLAAMLLICAGIALRSLPAAWLLFVGTAVIGCGIALGNVLLPGIIKRDHPGHVAKLTGAYSLTMGAAAALGSALVVPLAASGAGWHGALLGLMLFPIMAIVLWLPQLRASKP
ncbi:MFS transporter, partial [Phytobacter massiliensis]